MKNAWRIGWLAGAVALALRGAAGAQVITLTTVEDLDFDRPEAWAMKRTAALLMFTSVGPPADREDGELELSLESIWNPGLSRGERTVGFKGTKEEDINRLPVVPRPRLTMGIGFNTTFELAYIPPVEIEGIEPNVLAVALERPVYRCDDLILGLRLFGQLGTAKGDITCSEDDARDGIGGCLAPSEDEVQLNYAGLALTGGYELPENVGGSLFFGLYAAYLDLEFQVNALLEGRRFDVRDRTRQMSDGWIYGLTGGYSRPVGENCRLGVEAFYAPLDVMRGDVQGGDFSTENDSLFNLRAMLTYEF
ncbi:MAG: hypothetical protein HKO57_08130 [Akkermansiaceae bacterium]|nr:hypothetical protein [Akkermansiaceae bacterium]